MKRICLLILPVIILLLSACGCTDQITARMQNHPAKALLAEENPENPYDASAKCRYVSCTEGTCYISYSVYKDLTEQEMEQIADFIELGLIAGFNDSMQYKKDGEYEHPVNIAFYMENTEELIAAFVFKGGRRQEPGEGDRFIPGNRFDSDFLR